MAGKKRQGAGVVASDGDHPVKHSGVLTFIRQLATMAGCVAVAAFALLFSPPVKPDDPAAKLSLVKLVTVSKSLHFHANCDAPAFTRCARDPSRLFAQEKMWQSRPGYVWAGRAFSLPFRVEPLKSLAARFFQREDATEYAGYILLNLVLLTGALMVFSRAVGVQTVEFFIVPAMSLLLFNEVSKAFFWTPHLQMFNILAPTLTVALGLWALNLEESPKPWLLAILAFGFGVASLIYGAFAILIASFSICVIVQDILKHRRFRILALAWRMAMMAALYATPLLAWTFYVRHRTGTFYSHEIEAYRQFVWVADAMKEGLGAFFAAFAKNTRQFGRTLIPTLAIPGVVCIVLGGAMLGLGIPFATTPRQKNTYLSALIAFIVAFLFYGMLGYYVTRLTWGLVPPLIFVATEQVRNILGHFDELDRKTCHLVIIVFSLGNAIYWVSRYGPFF